MNDHSDWISKIIVDDNFVYSIAGDNKCIKTYIETMTPVGTFFDGENGHTDRIKGGCLRDDGPGQ